LDENGFFASVQPLLWVDQVDQAANMNMQEMGRYNCFKQTAIPDGATIVVGRSSNCSQTVQPLLVIICRAALLWTTVSNMRPSSASIVNDKRSSKFGTDTVKVQPWWINI